MYPIDLFKGWPSPDLIPADALKEAAVKALSNNVISVAGFGYGPDEGYAPLRGNIGQWLTQFYDPQEAISSSRICITGGASQNLTSILQVFKDPLQTKMIWLVEPTYHLVFQAFEDAGFHARMRGIPEDESGWMFSLLSEPWKSLPLPKIRGILAGAMYVCFFNDLTFCTALIPPRLENQRDPIGRSTSTSYTVHQAFPIHQEQQ